MTELALMLRPRPHGWSVSLTDGRELARFCGPGARWRAEHYLANLAAAEASQPS